MFGKLKQVVSQMGSRNNEEPDLTPSQQSLRSLEKDEQDIVEEIQRLRKDNGQEAPDARQYALDTLYCFHASSTHIPSLLHKSNATFRGLKSYPIWFQPSSTPYDSKCHNICVVLTSQWQMSKLIYFLYSSTEILNNPTKEDKTLIDKGCSLKVESQGLKWLICRAVLDKLLALINLVKSHLGDSESDEDSQQALKECKARLEARTGMELIKEGRTAQDGLDLAQEAMKVQPFSHLSLNVAKPLLTCPILEFPSTWYDSQIPGVLIALMKRYMLCKQNWSIKINFPLAFHTCLVYLIL